MGRVEDESKLLFKKVGSLQPITDYIFEVIDSRLSVGRKVLWLVAGGSSMDIAVEVARRLSRKDNLSLLSISLTDERYGPVGHPDSNWQQLVDKGFSLPAAKLHPVLNGADIKQTAAQYSEMLNTELSSSDYSIALAGL